MKKHIGKAAMLGFTALLSGMILFGKAPGDQSFPFLAEAAEAGVDIICPLEINRSKKYGGKFEAAKMLATKIPAAYWYPDLDPGDKAENEPELLRLGYHFTGIHTAFRAAMCRCSRSSICSRKPARFRSAICSIPSIWVSA